MLDPKKIILTQIFEGGGGGSSVDVEPLSITANGTYTAETGKAYSPVTANVPNSYAAGDEGKVVSNGALVSQTSTTITENSTVDTTLNNSVTVNVSGGGGGGLALLKTESLGTIQTSSTSAVDVGHSFTVSGCNTYDLLIVEVTASDMDPAVGTHISSVNILYLTGTIATTKSAIVLSANHWNYVKTPADALSSNQSTTAYGIYPTCSISDGTVTLGFKATYGKNYSRTINGNYTAKVYGVNLIGLLGA